MKSVRAAWFTTARTAAHPIGAYSIAALCVFTAIALQLLVLRWLGETVFLLLYPAVFLVAWLLGTGPGVFASGLGAVASIYFLGPQFIFHIPSAADTFRIVVFFLAGSTLSFLIGRGRIAEAGLHASEQRFRLFVLALTHDLRTPLTAAKSSAELILKYPDRTSAGQQGTSRILKSLQRIERMIQDILDASRVDAGEMLSIAPRESNLSAALETSLDDMRIVYGDRIVYYAPEDLPGRWDVGALKRCVENLVNNAAKYGRPGSPIQVTVARDDRGVRIEVHNEGEPIAEKEQERLFDAYHRSDGAMKSGIRGWGIGLTLVKGLVDAHKGTIRVKSAAGFGTSFIIELPRGSTEKRAA